MALYIKYHPVSSCDSLDCAPAGHDYIVDETVAHLLSRMGLDDTESFMVFVNRNTASLDTLLEDEDRIDIFPAFAGG
ncbi:MoaD/ThiS family protein [Desulfovibrio inopinatus]|uniref:MoaD/ThiS family protein n=1 Tax=Desulfovibrio inopinatus TaxID=102109 RepID=UPI0003FE2EC3|nr:MoaD/ThiS family protein [Desulfovibrio inopinatus]